MLTHGCLMLYKDTQTDTVVNVRVHSVHYNDTEPYYTIVLPCGTIRETERARLWHGNQAASTAAQPHQMPLDALQRARWFARQGAGNSRPGNAQHNSMINNLSAEDHTHKEETFLPTAPGDWKQVAEHLDLRPQSSNLMRSWRCIPVPAQTTIAHLVPVMRSISAHAPHPVLIMCASRTTSAYPQLQASSWPPSSYSPSRPTNLFHMLHMQDGSQLLAVCPCMCLTPW